MTAYLNVNKRINDENRCIASFEIDKNNFKSDPISEWKTIQGHTTILPKYWYGYFMLLDANKKQELQSFIDKQTAPSLFQFEIPHAVSEKKIVEYKFTNVILDSFGEIFNFKAARRMSFENK